jgi:outer membrane cobalamin receptor
MKMLIFLPLLVLELFAQQPESPIQEEVLTLTITTASKREESLAESAAIVTVITRDDLRQWGVDSLYEAISFIPGVELVESYFGYTTLNFRGVQQAHYNNKTLLLINGHPSFERVNGSFHLEQIPLALVERIEIVRGPGSALYGTNAFTGVINIITLAGEKVERSLALQGGSNNRARASFAWGGGNVEQEWALGLSYQNDDGYRYGGTADEPSSGGRKPVDFDYFNDIFNLFFEYKFKDVIINTSYFDQQKQKLGLTPEIS